MSVFEDDFRVSFIDVNEFNRLKPQSILRYLQELGGMHSNTVKDGLYYIQETNAVWILVGWKIKILKELKWNDNIHGKTWSRKTEKFYSYRDYELFNDNGELVAIATSKWVYISLETNSISKVPDELVARYNPEDRMVFETEMDKLKEPPGGEERYTYTISKRDIDTNSHVNNSYYLDFAMETLEADTVVTDVEIMYKKECKLGDTIRCMYTKLAEDEHVITIKNDDLTQVNAIIKIKTKI